MTVHRCDDWCVCPVDGKPLIYWPAGDQHACQDPDCTNAHGLSPDQEALVRIAATAFVAQIRGRQHGRIDPDKQEQG